MPRISVLSRRARAAVATVVAGAVVGAGVAVVVPAGAAASTLFVDNANPSCTDSGSGTASAPFCTIRQAAQVAVAGQTVSVASGTYGGDINPAHSGTASAPIVFAPAPGATVVVQGGANGFKVSSRSFIIIGVFTVTDTTGIGIDLKASTGIVLVANRVTRSGQPADGKTKSGIELDGTTSSLLIWNTTDHNSDAGVALVGHADNNLVVANASYANARGYVRAAAGFDIRGSSGNVLSADVSHDNEDSGFNVWTDSVGTRLTNSTAFRNGDHGIDVHSATSATVVANTVSGNVDSGIEVTTSSGTTIANNVSSDNGIDSPRTSGNLRVDSNSAGGTSVDDDLFFLRVGGVMIDWAGKQYSSLAAFRTATGREPHGLEADPQFVAASSGDFHLRAGSGAIDDANSGAPAQPTTDADNRARADDPATPNTGRGPIGYVDRGAFEFRP
jgi:parallel beta-helix repeat protein